MFKFILKTKLLLIKKRGYYPQTREETILLSMGLPYLVVNGLYFLTPLNLKYSRKAKNNNWKEKEYNEFLSYMTCYFSSLTDGTFKLKLTTRSILKDQWGIKNRNSALNTLNWLRFEGHRSYFNEVFKLRKELKDLDFDSIKKLISICKELNYDVPGLPEEFYYSEFSYYSLEKTEFLPYLEYNLNFSFSNERELPYCNLLAWDMARFINLIRYCRDSNYITTKEAWEMVNSVKEICFDNFNSWEEFSKSFSLGRKYWLKDGFSIGGPDSFCQDLLIDKLKPWTHFEWR